MTKLRQRLDLEPKDIRKDAYINSYSPDLAFEEVCNWEGLINYSHIIKSWIKDIYRIKL